MRIVAVKGVQASLSWARLVPLLRSALGGDTSLPPSHRSSEGVVMAQDTRAGLVSKHVGLSYASMPGLVAVPGPEAPCPQTPLAPPLWPLLLFSVCKQVGSPHPAR